MGLLWIFGVPLSHRKGIIPAFSRGKWPQKGSENKIPGLVNIQKANWKPWPIEIDCLPVYLFIAWWFSIVMLVYQRVPATLLIYQLPYYLMPALGALIHHVQTRPWPMCVITDFPSNYVEQATNPSMLNTIPMNHWSCLDTKNPQSYKV